MIYRPEGHPFEGGGIRVNLLVAWKKSEEPLKKGLELWYVVTSLESPQKALTYYRRRMWIDEGFKEARLMAGLVLATLVLTLLGLFGLPAGFRRAVLGRGKGSFLWLALQLLEQAKPPGLMRALKQAANAGGLL